MSPDSTTAVRRCTILFSASCAVLYALLVFLSPWILAPKADSSDVRSRTTLEAYLRVVGRTPEWVIREYRQTGAVSEDTLAGLPEHTQEACRAVVEHPSHFSGALSLPNPKASTIIVRTALSAPALVLISASIVLLLIAHSLSNRSGGHSPQLR